MTTKEIEQLIINNLASTQYSYKNGLLESLVSQANIEHSIVDIIKEEKEGKKMYNTVSFIAGLDSNEGGVKTQKTEVTRFEMQKRTVDKESMDAYLKGETTLITDLVSAMINNILKNIDITLISMYEGGRGNNSTATTKPVEVMKNHLFANFDAIVTEFFDCDINSQYIVVGGSTLDRNVRMLDVNNSGVYFVDSNMSANNLGSRPANNDWFAYAAGAIKLLEFNDVKDFAHIYVPTTDNTPFAIPFNVSYDDDTETYALEVVKFFDLFVPYMKEYGVNQMFRVRPNLDMLV